MLLRDVLKRILLLSFVFSIATSQLINDDAQAKAYMDALDEQVKSTAQTPSDPPNQEPSDPPSQEPSDPPSQGPSDPPSQEPSDPPSQEPSDPPSQEPSDPPSQEPSDPPSQGPSDLPSQEPSDPPSQGPSDPPSQGPSDPPSQEPSDPPSQGPSDPPSQGPSDPSSTPGPSEPPTPSLRCTEPSSEEAAEVDLIKMENALRPFIDEVLKYDWIYNTDNVEGVDDSLADAKAAYNAEYLKYWENIIDCYEYETFNDTFIRRQFELQAKPGTSALSEEDQKALSAASTAMTDCARTKICPYKKSGCKDEEKLGIDDLEGMFGTIQDMEELAYYWEEWRDVAGAPTLDDYKIYVDLLNKAAKMEGNDFKDASELWIEPYVLEDYSSDDFKSEIEDLWDSVKDMYYRLHAYVRYRLRTAGPYKEEFGRHSPIPAHILGNMYAQSWENVYSLVAPFEEVKLVDITEALTDNIENVDEMFDYAEDFFTSINMFEMTEKYDTLSMKVEEEGKDVNCHASAWDFYSVENPREEGDYRIKMCTDRTQEDFIVIHHEMGHTEYQMAYSYNDDLDQTNPLIYRDGANPGFHEAIGDTIALSVSTATHLEALKENITGEAVEQPSEEDREKRDMNQLMKTALAKVAFIPYAYILDKFRWDVFTGDNDRNQLNYEWWKLRVQVQGVRPPVLRLKDTDFDVGSKYHVAAGVPYVRYFVSHILQFQFHERLCEFENATAVHLCDIYDNEEAGNHLRKMLEYGRTKPYDEQLEEFLDADGKMNASSLLEYFKPLDDWIKGQIEEHNIPVELDNDVDKYFKTDIPATVPIVVGIVLLCMIGVVIIAFFVGKRRQNKKSKDVMAAETGTAGKKGKSNPVFEMDQVGRGSVSSAGSGGDAGESGGDAGGSGGDAGGSGADAGGSGGYSGGSGGDAGGSGGDAGGSGGDAGGGGGGGD